MKTRLIGLILILMLLSVAFFNFCRYTMMPMVMTGGQVISASMMDSMMNCATNPANCPMNLQEHQTSFFQLFPAIVSRVAVPLFMIVLALWMVVHFRIPYRDSVYSQRWKHLFLRFKVSIVPFVLLQAFSRGILHPKLHA